MALQQKNIELEDAIDVREIKSIRLANQVLKLRRGKKEQKDREMQQQNIQMQSQANAQAAQQAAQVDVQKNQAMTASKVELANAENSLEMQRMQQDLAHKKELMALEFQYNMQLKGMDTQNVLNREQEKEDRKDKRTKIQATQQSEMIDQRKTGKPPKNFEGSSNDTIGGNFDLGPMNL
tara:strand:- start:48 stop:584 length:537 start_codon:yes stop_codon:yes gene_type:complete